MSINDLTSHSGNGTIPVNVGNWVSDGRTKYAVDRIEKGCAILTSYTGGTRPTSSVQAHFTVIPLDRMAGRFTVIQ